MNLTSTLNMLPAEILEVIFSYLGDCDLVNVQQVSKQFRRIVVYYYWWPKLKKIIGVWTFLKSLLNHKLLYNMFLPIFCIYRWRLPSRIESKAELDWNPRGSFGSRPILFLEPRRLLLRQDCTFLPKVCSILYKGDLDYFYAWEISQFSIILYCK